MEVKDYKPGMEIVLPGFAMQGSYGGSATWHSTELAASGYTTICPAELRFTVPADFNAVKAEVASIDQALTEAADSYHTTVANLRERKKALLCLTHSSAEPEILDADSASSIPQTFTDVEADDDTTF